MRPAPGRAGSAGASRRLGLHATAVALALTLAACTSPAGGTGRGQERSGAPARAATTTTPPSTALDRGQTPERELSFHEYQQALAQIDQQVVASLRNLAKAGSHNALRDQTLQSAKTVSDAAARLDGITPPAHLRNQHGEVALGLGALGPSLSLLAARVHDQELCTASAVVEELGKLAAAGQLRAATHAFDAAGGGRVTFLPNLGRSRPVRPANGQHLRPKATSGGHELVFNSRGVGRDTVVTAEHDDTRAVLTVYVRGKSQVTVGDIGDGGYTFYYSHGRDWDPRARRFARDCEFNRTLLPVILFTRPEVRPDGIYEISNRYTLWFAPTGGGDVLTESVAPDDFPM